MNKILSCGLALIAALGLSAGAASAVTLTVDGHRWSVSTIQTEFPYYGDMSPFTSQVWWDDRTLAEKFARAYLNSGTALAPETMFAYDTLGIYSIDFFVAWAVIQPVDGTLPFATQEYVTVTKVPLPAGGVFLLTGLAAAAGLGYRKKRTA
jgi:hypothetical protein